MSSVSPASFANGYSLEGLKGWTFPADAQPSFYDTENIFEKLRLQEEAARKALAEAEPTPVWGKITLPSGELVTVYEGGGVQSENELDIDWDLNDEISRTQAILAKYGGELKLESASTTTDMSASDLLSTILDSPALSARMLGVSGNQSLADALLADDGL
ncbi:hypothetical protein [Rhizobium sp. FKL33]|uniref:hypothetical protein n=1 Tax=Rhizobium sp. FKL33 TaxID=2562307 RepID=UPI0010C01055|nr:hypothetical protein [Rhizobium sp. FKL33]